MVQFRYPLAAAAIIIIMAAAMIATGCDQTAAQKVAVANATLAKSNLSVIQGAIELNKTGTLTDAQTRNVLEYNKKVLQASETIRKIQANPGEWPASAVEIKKAVEPLITQKILDQFVDPGVRQQVAALLAVTSSSLTIILQEVQ